VKQSQLAAILARPGCSGEDLDVKIRTGIAGVPTAIMADVASAVRGGDWTKGMLILLPDPVLIPTKRIEHPRDLALFTLGKLQQCRGRSYVPNKMQDAWVEGFVQGVRAYVTHIGTQDKEHP